MSVTTLNTAWIGDRSPAVSAPRAAIEKIAIGFLTISLLLSFLQYCFERSDLVRLVPVAFLLVGAALCLIFTSRNKRREVLMSVLNPWTLLAIALVTLPPIVSAWFLRSTPFPFQYGLVMIVSLAAIRILLSEIGFEGLLLSFLYGTTAGFL